MKTILFALTVLTISACGDESVDDTADTTVSE